VSKPSLSDCAARFVHGVFTALRETRSHADTGGEKIANKVFWGISGGFLEYERQRTRQR
jgi:hypothetical protein